MAKKIFMIAGPNGAGKTTTATSLMSDTKIIYEFINADEIARGLAPMHPESMALTASKLMLKRLKELLDAGKNFAFETTASGKNYIKHLKAARANGYQIHLLFLWLNDPELAVKRVAERVVGGGHHIPEDVIRRRYYLGLKNLVNHFLPLADNALILDNSITDLNRVIARKNNMNDLEIEQHEIWKKIEGVVYVE